MKDFLTIGEAALIRNVSRQSIYTAIIKKRLNATQGQNKVWQITYEDLSKYQNTLYNRDCSYTYNGEKIFNSGKYYTLKTLAKKANVSYQKIHYFLRIGLIPHEKKGWTIAITKEVYDNIFNYLKDYIPTPIDVSSSKIG